MPKKVNYTCFRCGYETNHKTNMKNHLFFKKAPCPQTLHIIELTDEIKQHILDNRIYILPTPPTNIINNITTNNNNTMNNNTMNNYIIKMDALDKLKKFTSYKDIELIDFKDNVEQKFLKRANKFADIDKDMGYSEQDLILHIEEVCQVFDIKTFQDFNLLYDKKMKQVQIYDDGEWSDMLIDNGIYTIMTVIQSFLWNKFEFYMIRKSLTENLHQKQVFKERLEDYYTFIGNFKIKPAILTHFIDTDNVEMDNDLYEVKDEYIKLYKNIKKDKANGNALRKQILDRLEYNMSMNIEKMNKKVAKLFSLDENFKNIILKSESSEDENE
jgi:hypothetical protein